jgi:uridine kinase
MPGTACSGWRRFGHGPLTDTTRPAARKMAFTVLMDAETAAGLVVDLVSGCPGRPLLVAIDGASAAGTTTLATAVGRRLGASVVAGDDFYRDLPEQRRRALTPAEGVEQYFDWQRLRREALQPLRAGRTARYRPYDWRSGAGVAQHVVEVSPTPVVILDGVYSARPELHEEIDLAVLVETPPEERRRRLVARGHGNDGWWPRWNAAEALYYATVRPAGSFDLVVPGA